MVKTPPFHGGNTGSNPVRVIKKDHANLHDLFLLNKLRYTTLLQNHPIFSEYLIKISKITYIPCISVELFRIKSRTIIKVKTVVLTKKPTIVFYNDSN